MTDILEHGENTRQTAQTATSKTANREDSKGTKLIEGLGGDAIGAVGTRQEGWMISERRLQDRWWLNVDSRRHFMQRRGKEESVEFEVEKNLIFV